MAVKNFVAGKRQITIRLKDEDYRMLQVIAAYDGVSVNEWIVNVAVEMAKEVNSVKKVYRK